MSVKKILIILCFFLTIICLNTEVIAASDYYVRSYIVMDYNSGEILDSKEKDLIRSVASISKIMTAIVAIENAPLDKYIEVTDDILKAYGSSIYLQIGEVVSVKDLLYGLMLRSGNDAAITLARGISGNVSSFVELMNNKAKEIPYKLYTTDFFNCLFILFTSLISVNKIYKFIHFLKFFYVNILIIIF